MKPLTYFKAIDAGCYADGAFGHQHCRETLASLVQGIAERSNRWGAKSWGVSIGELVDSLRGDMPDDAWDEDTALEILNEVTEGAFWQFVDGDLCLIADDKSEARHG
jgi:hypothetical protein